MTNPTPHDDVRPVALVIDDSPDVQRLLKAHLRHEELDFIGADDGAQGVRLAGQIKPAIIILDLDMPGTNGLGVLRSLKTDSRTQPIPVIVLSAHGESEYKVAAYDLGAVDYITKPFELAELRLRLRSSLRIHQLMQLLSQRAQLDGLTGLWNRAYFDARWCEEHARASRHGLSLCLAMLDVDYFKQVNDTRGHPTGDQVLLHLAKLLRREMRQSDLVCRYGGEEFAIIMPETPPADARTLCERLRESVQVATFPGLASLHITVSIGVLGSVGGTPISTAAWIEQADRNLYTAKNSGRNKVVVTEAKPSGDMRLRLAS